MSERRTTRDRRTPDTERRTVIPDRRRDGIARRVVDAIIHAARMRMLYPNPNERKRRGLKQIETFQKVAR